MPAPPILVTGAAGFIGVEVSEEDSVDAGGRDRGGETGPPGLCKSRDRAATQPPIALVVRNTTGARTTYVVGPGTINFEIVKSAADWSIPMTMYTPIAMLMLTSQSRLRSEDQTMDGTERQA